MSLDPGALDEETLTFLVERHLATLTNVRADGTPHVVPVGFTYEPETRLARVITGGGSVKARLAARPGAVAALCQVDGRRWLTLQGPIHVESDPESVADAVERYAARYRQPRVNPERVVLVVEVERVLGHG
ncbi:TIGR03618 family F420-dependent PPOX class oxidoreductase [Microlunatus spumicola]|uniref:TIGR03618 family F420-dependent PPOX class oxidoreductase n=1 Tax=Microlunatus spumicola TaxID=81499 RepID=A0ABP6XDB4_9ACTN